jgi:26S proteasome non-ATPase regulatory subunit 9
MGFTLPSPTSPAEQARALIAKKEAIELEISANFSVLKANDAKMHGPLVDHEGFPRSDIDVWAVRTARVRIIELNNDLDRVMGEIAIALKGVYNTNAAASPPKKIEDKGNESVNADSKPFAKVGAVSPGSPAADAVSRCHLCDHCDCLMVYSNPGPPTRRPSRQIRTPNTSIFYIAIAHTSF